MWLSLDMLMGTDRMVDVAVVGTVRRPRHFYLIPMRGLWDGCAGTAEMGTFKGGITLASINNLSRDTDPGT